MVFASREMIIWQIIVLLAFKMKDGMMPCTDPLTREPATLFITLFGIFPTFISSVQCWQYSSLSVASAIHVFLLASTWARMTIYSWIENAFFFGSLTVMENESQPEIKIKLLTQQRNKCWNLWSLVTCISHLLSQHERSKGKKHGSSLLVQSLRHRIVSIYKDDRGDSKWYLKIKFFSWYPI